MLALRCEPDVRHHRYSGSDDLFDLFRTAPTPFQLDGVRTRLLHESDCIVQCVIRASLVGAERQVGNDQCALSSAHHGPTQRNQLFDRHGKRRVVAEHCVAGRITDEQKVDPGAIENRRR